MFPTLGGRSSGLQTTSASQVDEGSLRANIGIHHRVFWAWAIGRMISTPEGHVRVSALAALAFALSQVACTPATVAVSGGAAGGVAASQERGFSTAVQDQGIRLNINERLFATDIELFSDVGLQVQEGRVLLTGNVQRPEHRVEAARLVWEVPGVREVYNEIQVRDEQDVIDSGRDEWIILQIKTDLLLDSEVSAVNYSVESVNQIVYLIGIARDRDELDRVVRYAKDVPYVRGVVNYVRLADSVSG